MDADFWYRMVLLSLSSFLVGSTFVISVRYFFAWRKRDHDWRGLLPLHVFVVTVSYDLMLIYSTVETMLRINDDADTVWWRAALLVPAYATGFVAMWSIARLRAKKRLVENP